MIVSKMQLTTLVVSFSPSVEKISSMLSAITSNPSETLVRANNNKRLKDYPKILGA
jgi:hypothetical protein